MDRWMDVGLMQESFEKWGSIGYGFYILSFIVFVFWGESYRPHGPLPSFLSFFLKNTEPFPSSIVKVLYTSAILP